MTLLFDFNLITEQRGSDLIHSAEKNVALTFAARCRNAALGIEALEGLHQRSASARSLFYVFDVRCAVRLLISDWILLHQST